MDVAFLKFGVVEPEDFAHEGNSFLERMRHSSSFELVRQIKTFIMTFTTMEGLPNDFSSYLQRFMEEISRMLIDHSQWREEGEKGLKDALEALERYLLQKLYSTAFYIPTSTDSEDDEKFYHRVRMLQFLQPDHFDIPTRQYNQLAFEMSAQELSRLEEDVLKSPKEKLQCVINAVIIIINLLKHSDNGEMTGADDLLPNLIYLLLVTSPKHIHSNLRYIRRFRRPSMLTSEEAYYLTHMESAVMFISTLDHNSLSISKEEFLRGVQDAEERIKQGRDVPRRFSKAVGWNNVLSVTNQMFQEQTGSQSPSTTSSTRGSQSSTTDQYKLVEEEEEEDVRDKPHLPTEGDTVAFPIMDDIEKEDLGITEGIVTVTSPTLHLLPSVKNCIIPKLLQTRFEELTIQDLKQMYTCYQTMAKQIEDIEQ